ncbi:TetR/AcrR family transcriptional regulator [Microbacterium gilvum]|uniref:HTH tetR-type domain-containing protein n=1 Tax=Microbacterium gilvum TaxID=1336204 RepID=A0ABP9AI65_9MICO
MGGGEITGAEAQLDGVTAPKQKRSALAFSRVKQAALDLMCDPDTVDFRLADVSRAAGVSIGSIYARVQGKAELVRLVQREELERLNAELDAIGAEAEGHPSLEAAADAMVRGYVRALAERADLLRYLAWVSTGDAEIRRQGRASEQAARGVFVRVLREACDRAGIAVADDDLAWCFQLVNGVLAHSLSLNTLRADQPVELENRDGIAGRLSVTIIAFLRRD